MYSYLKCVVYEKLLKPRQSFRITLSNTCGFALQQRLQEHSLILHYMCLACLVSHRAGCLQYISRRALIR